MKQILIFFSLLVLCIYSSTSNEISSAVEYKAQAFDVLKYTANIEFESFNTKDINANCLIEFAWKNKSTDNKFFFNLKGLLVDSCFYNGKKVIAQISEIPVDGENYYIINPESDYKDTSQLLIFYSGIMENEGGSMAWGGVTYQDSLLFAMGVGFNNPYVSSTRFWLPCYDHPSDKALYKFRFTVPDSLMVTSNGNLLIEEPASDGKATYRWTGGKEAATYMLTFAVGKFHKLEFGNDSLSMPVYTLEKNIDKCQSGFKLLPKMVEIFEKYYGKYPFEKVGYVVAPIGSMEHQTMITLAEDAISTVDTISSTVAHELSHQWFGGLVTPLDFREAWLNEGFATYSEALYAEELFDKAKYLKAISTDVSNYINVATNEGIFPLWDFKRESPSSNYPSTIYYKGAVVIAMLRYELGDEVFFNSIKNYLLKFANSNSTTADLLKVINETSGRDLSDFFAQWVYGKGYPILSCKTKYHPYVENPQMGSVDINILQTQAIDWGIYNNLPLEVYFLHTSTEKTVKIIKINSTETNVHIDSIPKFLACGFNAGYELKVLAKISNSTLGIEDKVVKLNVSAYPNPVVDYLKISNYKTEGLENIQIFDILGNYINKVNIEQFDGTLSTKNLNKGTYQLILNYNNSKEYVIFSK